MFFKIYTQLKCLVQYIRIRKKYLIIKDYLKTFKYDPKVRQKDTFKKFKKIIKKNTYKRYDNLIHGMQL